MSDIHWRGTAHLNCCRPGQSHGNINRVQCREQRLAWHLDDFFWGAVNFALIHSATCRELLNEGELEDAVRDCVAQGIEPPMPPRSKLFPDYERCVELAKETLSDYGWWEKRLKVLGARFRRQSVK